MPTHLATPLVWGSLAVFFILAPPAPCEEMSKTGDARPCFIKLVPTLDENLEPLPMTARSIKNYHLKRPPTSLAAAFQLMAATPSGQALIKEFRPVVAKHQVRFAPFPAEVVEKLAKGERPWGPNPAAHFEPDRSTIGYDATTELGVLVPSLFHQMSRATDSEALPLWRERQKKYAAFQKAADRLQSKLDRREAAKKDLNAEVATLEKLKIEFLTASDAHRFTTERRAHEAESAFLSELFGLFPCYDAYLAGRREKYGVFAGIPTDETLIRAYGLDATRLGKQLKAQPTPSAK